MSSLFICANAYNAISAIDAISTYYSDDIDCVIICDRIRSKKFINDSHIRIIENANIYECINSCDCVLLINDGTLPKETVVTVKKTAKRKNKKYVELSDNFKINTEYKKYSAKSLDDKTPTILLISYNNSIQFMKFELMLNKVFLDMDVPFNQFFSKKTKLFSNAMNKFISFENASKQHKSNHENETANIGIYSYLFNSKNELIQSYDILKRIKADYIIVLLPNRFDNDDKEFICNYFKYSIMSDVDMIIKSHYTILDDDYLIYEDLIDESFEYIDIENSEINELLKRKIIAKLGYPFNISPM